MTKMSPLHLDNGDSRADIAVEPFADQKGDRLHGICFSNKNEVRLKIIFS